MTLIDLSVPLDTNNINDPVLMPVKIAYFGHKETVSHLQTFFPDLRPEELPQGEGWAIERVELTTHNGTHLDAPYHYASTTNNGERAITIDEVPLEWCYQPGIKLDLSHLPDGAVAQPEDLEEALAKIEHTLSPLEIVLIHTGASKHYNTKQYLASGCGIGRKATLYLLEKGIKVTGTDAWSWDAPFVYTAERYARERDPSIIWEGHKAGLEREFCHIEKLHNLEKLPAKGFVISCFPVKIRGASAGWTRAVAILT